VNEIKAIETRYAGCRFRSRLEARWAVFFDHLGVQWRYEAEGYQLSSGVRYLPDFFLPDLDTWVEVKGALQPEEFKTLVRAAVELPRASSLTATPVLLLLGDVPVSSGATTFTAFTKVDHSAILGSAFFAMGIESADPEWVLMTFGRGVIFRPDQIDAFTPLFVMEHLCRTATISGDESCLQPNSFVREALTRARSARFEHGEQG
jgi:hypothetical protein